MGSGVGLRFYELRKFFGMLLNCNPNVLSLLWLMSFCLPAVANYNPRANRRL
jgi:predicted nucleotidyltransferase